MAQGFAAGESQWRARLGSLRQVVRQELVTRQLLAHLPAGARVLDVGCGQGTQVLALAGRGFAVTGVDASASLLADLRGALSPDLRVTVVHGDLFEVPALFEASSFDVVLCHGVLMYLDAPGPAVEALASVVAPGGLLSLLVRNGDALALRPGLAGDWAAARAAFDGADYVNRIGVRARGDRLADLSALLSTSGLAVEAWYGVRVFTDLAADDAALPADLELLLECEELAGRTDPYRSVAALTHVLGRRLSPSR